MRLSPFGGHAAVQRLIAARLATKHAGVLPLYENLPLAAAGDPKLYELLALFDALRIGQALERELAKKLLEQRLQ